MKKKVLAGIMMAVMMMVSVMSVSAAGSKSGEAYPSGSSSSSYVTYAYEGVFKDLPAEAQSAIADLEAGKIPESIVEDIADIKTQLAGKKLICEVFDLQPVGDHSQCTNGHKLQMTIPALKNCKNVVVLHYSETRGYWEVVKDVKVDGTTLTGTFQDLSPVAIYAEPVSGGAAGTSPSTVGTSSTWMLWAAVAIVALGTGVVAIQKKSRS